MRRKITEAGRIKWIVQEVVVVGTHTKIDLEY